MKDEVDLPPGFAPCVVRSAFPRALGTFYERKDPGVGRTMRIRVEEAHCNALGSVHGGFTLTLMDFAMTYGSYEPDDFPPCVTLSLTTNFLRTAPLGSWLEARVVIERIGPSVLFNRCAVMAGEEQIASGQGVFKPVPLPPSASQ